MRAAVVVAALGAAVATLASGCGRAPAVRYPDAPLQLRDDDDRDLAVDALDAMPLGPAHDAARARIADALAARLADELTAHPSAAQTLLLRLVDLWQRDPGAVGAGLRAHAALLHRARDVFARQGATEATILALVVLGEVEPARRAETAGEVDEILAYADELAASEGGAAATRVRPIAMLRPTALSLPLPAVVDRYVGLLAERQRVVSKLFLRDTPSAAAVRAHRDVLTTSRRIASALARAGRATELHAHLGGLEGIGIDRAVAARAAILAEQPSASAYVELARALRSIEDAGSPADDRDDDARAADPAAALAVCVSGLARYPDDLDLLDAAATYARTIGHVDQAIALLSRLAARDPAQAPRLGRLYAERIERLASGGRPGAATAAWRELRDVAARGNGHGAWDDALGEAQAALGRGLVAAGDLDGGKRALSAAIARAPTVDAYETSAVVELQLGRYAPATRDVARGLRLLGDSAGDRYRRAKLERLAGDAMRRGGRARDAGDAYLDALHTWASLGDARALPRSIAAERMFESGRMLWWLTDRDRGVELVLRAVDVDDDTPATATGAVAFLLEVGHPTEAAEAYHRVLASEHLGEHDKVHMALWLVGDAQRRGVPRDRLANEYLASRTGDVWYELLAEAATGRARRDALRAAATTAPRRAELAFYTATLLGGAPARPLLEQVVAAHLVLDAQYDLARAYLGR